ncbi:MAG TPA: ABC transporter permease subunit, partial [Gemmataceae bacterium]|nr:ABC transporter permease subunit [Gemmataceae bacterium]
FAPREALSYKPPPEFGKSSKRPNENWTTLYRENQVSQKLPPAQHNSPPPFSLLADPIQIAVAGAYSAALESEDFRQAVAFVSFSRGVVFNIFATFLLPLCSLSFATEALGREREQRNLLWTLTRPVPRPAIYLGKFVAMLPWCLLLNVGGSV